MEVLFLGFRSFFRSVGERPVVNGCTGGMVESLMTYF